MDLTLVRLRLIPGAVLELDSVSKMKASHNELVALPLDFGDQVGKTQGSLAYQCKSTNTAVSKMTAAKNELVGLRLEIGDQVEVNPEIYWLY